MLKIYWECFMICSIWLLLGSLEQAMLTEGGSAHVTLSLYNTLTANSTFRATQERKPVLEASQKASFPSVTGSSVSDLSMASSHHYREHSRGKSFVSTVSYPSHRWHLCYFRCQREKALNSCYCKRKQKATEWYSKLKCFINYLSKTGNLSEKQIYVTVSGEHLRKTKEKTWSVVTLLNDPFCIWLKACHPGDQGFCLHLQGMCEIVEEMFLVYSVQGILQVAVEIWRRSCKNEL